MHQYLETGETLELVTGMEVEWFSRVENCTHILLYNI